MMRPALLLLVSVAMCAEAPDVTRTVKAIGERCSNAAGYSFEGDLLLVSQREGAPARTLSHARVKLAAAGGKSYLRVEAEGKDAYLLISNGKKNWAYVPKLKQYTEDEASSVEDDHAGDNPSDSERDPAEQFSRMVMRVLTRLPATTLSGDFNGEAQVKFGNHKQKWPVLRVISKPDAEKRQTLVQLAVEPERLSIGRMVYATAWRDGGVKTVLEMTIDFSRFDIGRAPEEAFEFEPPKGAKLVDAAPIPGQSGSFLLNQPAPDLELKTLEGDKVRLSELRGHPVLLNFWASWCPPCRSELPDLSELDREYKDKGLVILGVNDEDRATARRFAEKAGLTFPTLDDSGLKAHRLFRVYNIPAVFLIDRTGKVVVFMKGAKAPAKLKASLAAVGL